MQEINVYVYRDKRLIFFSNSGVNLIEDIVEAPENALILTDSSFINSARELIKLSSRILIWTTNPTSSETQDMAEFFDHIRGYEVSLDRRMANAVKERVRLFPFK